MLILFLNSKNVWKERAGCFIFIVFLMSCDCECSVTLPQVPLFFYVALLWYLPLFDSSYANTNENI